MRSLLTMVGICIGVWAVICLLAIGEGISEQAQKQIEGLGAENIIVRSVKPVEAHRSTETVSFFPTVCCVKISTSIVETIPTIETAIPIREMRREIRFAGRKIERAIGGVYSRNTRKSHRLEVERGHFITDAEVEDAKPHCVLAAKAAETLFPYEDPLDRTVYVQEHDDYYRIVRRSQAS